MRVEDADVERYLRSLTFLSDEEIAELMQWQQVCRPSQSETVAHSSSEQPRASRTPKASSRRSHRAHSRCGWFGPRPHDDARFVQHEYRRIGTRGFNKSIRGRPSSGSRPMGRCLAETCSPVLRKVWDDSNNRYCPTDSTPGGSLSQ